MGVILRLMIVAARAILLRKGSLSGEKGLAAMLVVLVAEFDRPELDSGWGSPST